MSNELKRLVDDIQYIYRKRYMKPLTIEQIANAVSYTRSHFSSEMNKRSKPSSGLVELVRAKYDKMLAGNDFFEEDVDISKQVSELVAKVILLEASAKVQARYLVRLYAKMSTKAASALQIEIERAIRQEASNLFDERKSSKSLVVS